MHQQALELIRVAVRRRPLDVSQTNSLVIITRNTAAELYYLGRKDEAIRESRTTLDLLDTLMRDNAAVPSFKTHYLDVAQVLRKYLARLDREEEAARLLDAERAVIEQLPREIASDWLFRARRLAATWNSSLFTYSGRQSAEVFRKSEELQAQAVAALRRACELGLKDTRVFASISFQQLSHRDDFKALVARFATGAGAGRTPAQRRGGQCRPECAGRRHTHSGGPCDAPLRPRHVVRPIRQAR